MKQSHWSRSVVSGVLGLIGVYLTYLSFPVEKHSVHGIALPGKNIRNPISPDKVIIHFDPSFSAQPLGFIHLALHIKGDASNYDEQQIATKAGELAATLGANGIVEQSAGVTGVGPFRVLIFRGLAIYEPRGGS